MKKQDVLALSFLWPICIHACSMVINDPIASIRTAAAAYSIGQEHNAKASRSMFGPSYELFMKKLPPEFRDPAQSSQALYNEPVICLETLKNGWLKVKFPEQYSYNTNKKCIEHVAGYIKSNQAIPSTTSYKPNIVVTKPWADIFIKKEPTINVPMGTKLYSAKKNKNWHTVLLADGRTGKIKNTDIYHIKEYISESEEAIRNSVTETAQQLMGGPYCWGGRSPCFNTIAYDYSNVILLDSVTPSCDCSGFVNLVYRTHGFELPRNSHPQWLASKKIKYGSTLKPGDLIFFARPANKERVHHVLMYLGNEMVIESAVSRGICTSKTMNRFGQPVAKLTYGNTIRCPGESTRYVIYFGSYINDKKRLNYMRDYALGNYNVT